MSNIYYFLLLFLVSSTLMAQEYPTRGEIYNYEVGDIFHFTEEAHWGGEGAWGGMGATVNMEVIFKEYSENDSTLKYKFFKRSLIGSSEQPEPYIEERIDSIIYYDLDQIISGDTLYENPNFYNGRKTIASEGENGYDYIKSRYTAGCGRSYYLYEYSYPYAWTEYEVILVYYKKGDEEWGEEQVIVSIPDIDTDNYLVKVFPNPIKESVNIRMNDSFNNQRLLVIWSLTGQQMAQFPINSIETKIDRLGLNSGIYIYQIISSSGALIQSDKLIIL